MIATMAAMNRDQLEAVKRTLRTLVKAADASGRSHRFHARMPGADVHDIGPRYFDGDVEVALDAAPASPVVSTAASAPAAPAMAPPPMPLTPEADAERRRHLTNEQLRLEQAASIVAVDLATLKGGST